MSDMRKFIQNAGGCVVSNNILSGRGKLKWCIREDPINDNDNGWRFLSDIDTDQYLNNPNNMSICDFNTVAEIEPAILAIYNCEIGTDIELVDKKRKKVFIDSNTGKPYKI